MIKKAIIGILMLVFIASCSESNSINYRLIGSYSLINNDVQPNTYGVKAIEIKNNEIGLWFANDDKFTDYETYKQNSSKKITLKFNYGENNELVEEKIMVIDSYYTHLKALKFADTIYINQW